MAMRYLGWGIGHLNPPDFPHEAFAIKVTDADRASARASNDQGQHATAERSAGSSSQTADDEDEDDEEEEDPDKYFNYDDDLDDEGGEDSGHADEEEPVQFSY